MRIRNDVWSGLNNEDMAEIDALIDGPTGYVSPRKEKKAKKPPEFAVDDPNRLRGTIAKYIGVRRFGFITADDGDEADAFFHAESFPAGTQIRRGARVTYEIAIDARRGARTHAVNVRVVQDN